MHAALFKYQNTHTHTLALRTFANNAHLCACLYFVFAVGHTFLSRALSLSLSFCLPSRRLLCVFKTYCAARIFSTMWVALSLSSRRVAAPAPAHRVVCCVCVCVCKESVREQQTEEYFSSCFSMKMPYGSSSYATVGGETEAATQTVLIYAKM